MQYRVLARSEATLLSQIDRSEIIDHIYKMREGKLELTAEHYDVPDWSPAEKVRRIDSLCADYDEGATLFGAFDQDMLVGLSVLSHSSVGSGDHRLNLNGLWVSCAYRNRGVGTQLVQLAAQEARRRGSRYLYVSATRSENSVRFYMGLGMRLAQPPDPLLLQKEPEDIHLELCLG